SVRLMTSPLATTAGPLLVMVSVKLVLSPACTRASSATFVMLNTASRSTGIGGVSSSSSSGSVSGSLSGPQTVMPLVMVSPASAATSAVTFTTRVPPTATASLVVTVAVLPLPAAVPLPLVTSYPVMVTPVPGRSLRLMTSPLATTAGPLLVMVSVKLVLAPACTRASSATFVMLNVAS